MNLNILLRHDNNTIKDVFEKYCVFLGQLVIIWMHQQK